MVFFILIKRGQLKKVELREGEELAKSLSVYQYKSDIFGMLI